MQLSSSVILSIASLMAAVSAENVLVALNSDIGANVNQYLSYVQQNTAADVAPLLALYQQAQTYTDDSYTTLVDASQLASISAFAEQLPWYSSRILPELAVSASATATSGETSATETSATETSASETSASKSSESSEASSVKSKSSAPVSSAKTSSVPITSVEHTSSATHSTSASASKSTSVSTAGAALVAPGVGLLALGAIALL